MQANNYLIIEIGGNKYALDILEIDSIHSSSRKHIDYNFEDCSLGVRLFKKLIPIIDMRKKLKIQCQTKPLQPSTIFMKPKNYPDEIIGIQIDNTYDVHEINECDVIYENNLSYIPLTCLSNVEQIQIINILFLTDKYEKIPISTEIMN